MQDFVLEYEKAVEDELAYLPAGFSDLLEIIICDEGRGYVISNGEKFRFSRNEVILFNPEDIKLIVNENGLKYTSLKISKEFCMNIAIDVSSVKFKTDISNMTIIRMLHELQSVFRSTNEAFKKARLTVVILQILIELATNFVLDKDNRSKIKSNEKIKKAITYLTQNYSKKISLDEITRDKYNFSILFKKYTNQTVFQYLNNLRVYNATILIKEGSPVATAAKECGFDNMSFFSKTFKQYTGKLPSDIKRAITK